MKPELPVLRLLGSGVKGTKRSIQEVWEAECVSGKTKGSARTVYLSLQVFVGMSQVQGGGQRLQPEGLRGAKAETTEPQMPFSRAGGRKSRMKSLQQTEGGDKRGRFQFCIGR